MKDLQQRVENWVVSRRNSDFVWIAAGIFGASVMIGGVWDLWVPGLLVGLGFALLIRLALRHKLNILREPLRLSDPAVLQRIDGQDWVMVRAVLGRGRCMRPEQVEAWIQPEIGDALILSVEWIPDVVVGPWTIAIPCSLDEGELHVRLRGREGRHIHEQKSKWQLEELEHGAFSPVCDWKAGRFCGRVQNWDRVNACGSSSQAQP